MATRRTPASRTDCGSMAATSGAAAMSSARAPLPAKRLTERHVAAAASISRVKFRRLLECMLFPFPILRPALVDPVNVAGVRIDRVILHVIYYRLPTAKARENYARVWSTAGAGAEALAKFDPVAETPYEEANERTQLRRRRDWRWPGGNDRGLGASRSQRIVA